MSFHCKICDTDILPGAVMVANDRDELAHKECIPNAVSIPSVRIVASTYPPREPNLEAPKSPQTGDYVSLSAPAICEACGDPCIGMCPYCLVHVCRAYGWNGKTCALSHEAKCEGAKASREPRSSFLAGTVVLTRTPFSRDGQEVIGKKKRPKKNGRNR